MFKNILVATDGSSMGSKAVAAAASLANELSANLVLLTVVGQGDVSENMVHMFEVEHMIKDRASLSKDRAPTSGVLAPSVRASENAALAAEVHQVMAESIMQRSQEEVEKVLQSGLDCVIREGNPAEVILSVASDKGSDLIVMGSRGFGELKSLLMGSVSSKVNQLSSCPCLIVK